LKACNDCVTCQARKMPAGPSKAPMQSYHVGMPMERVALDILGPLPETLRGNKYVLVVTDYFTRWAEAYPLRVITAASVATTLVEQFISRFGTPRIIHSDQGRQFESQLFTQLCSLLQCQKTRTTPFHPQSDGLVERFNRTLEDMLSKYISPNQRDWDEIVPILLMAYRSSQHESTGLTPNLMMLGREVDLPIDLLYPPPPKEPITDQNEFVHNLQQQMKTVQSLARDQMLKASLKQKSYYDHKVSKVAYCEGDAVWLRIYSKTKGLSPKLQMKWEGPYKVTKKISDVTLKIQKSLKSPPKIVHFNRLKPYVGPLPSRFNSMPPKNAHH
ncbi:MAG: transposase family protein, partial [Sedimenticola sp.]